MDIDECDDVTARADHDKIASVLSNVIGNAIKYSPKQALVTIRCKMVPEEIIVSITENWYGIFETAMKKIFDRYYRVDENTARHIAGFGIGLYLSA